VIVGFGIEDIQASRIKKIPKGRINISSSPHIKSVKEINPPFSDKKALEVMFEFITKYEPDIGEIKIKGVVIYSGDKIKEQLKKWKKEKKLIKETDVEIKNFLFRKCLSLGITISEEMQLPPPIMFPHVVAKEQKKPDLSYIG